MFERIILIEMDNRPEKPDRQLEDKLRGGKAYTLVTLELDYQGSKVKIKCFEEGAKVGDYAQIEIWNKKKCVWSRVLGSCGASYSS